MKKKYKIIRKSSRTWIVESDKDDYYVWFDFDGWHCNCLYCCWSTELRKCSHIKAVKNSLEEDE